MRYISIVTLLAWSVLAAYGAVKFFFWAAFDADPGYWIARGGHQLLLVVGMPFLTLALYYASTHIIPGANFSLREFLLYFLVPYILFVFVVFQLIERHIIR